MPDIQREWHLWWLDFWAAHPIVFWCAVIVVIALSVAGRRFLP